MVVCGDDGDVEKLVIVKTMRLVIVKIIAMMIMKILMMLLMLLITLMMARKHRNDAK